MMKSDNLSQTTSNNPIHVSSLAEVIQHTESLISQSKQKIQIYSGNLDPRILNNQSTEQLLIKFIRSSRLARVEILIADENNLKGVDHRLVGLSQKFSSYVSIRVIPNDLLGNNFAFYLFDGKTIMYRSVRERYDCDIKQLPSSKVKKMAAYFSETWQQSSPASHLRALFI